MSARRTEEPRIGPPPGRPPRAPDGVRIYAIGDVHGRLDLLETLSEMIARDLSASPVPSAVEMFLGDYVDRGPHSRQVIEWLIDAPPIGTERICLMGNHETLLLGALSDTEQMTTWLYNGADTTLASYRAVPDLGPAGVAESARAAFAAALPQAHRTFLEALPRFHVAGDYLFVHAGLRPGRPLAEQRPEDLVWIREPFLRSDADHGYVVIHGHTPVAEPEIRRNRIDIDTGAVFSGHLTCLVLEDEQRRFLQTGTG